MSDFLTNLVIRSFSRTPSFQPMMVTAAAEPTYEEPEVTPQPMSEPPVVPPIQNTDRTDEDERIDAPQPLRVEVVPDNPKLLDSPKHEFTEKSVVPPPSETPKPEVHLTAPEITSTETQPVQTSVIVNPPVEFVRPSQTSSPRRRPTTTKLHKAEPPVVEQVIEHVTEQVIERPAVTIENKQQITKHEITKHALTTHDITKHALTTHEITEREITNSFTTLVPKPTAQPLPSVNVNKTRPKPPTAKGPTELEAAALPPETVINVAIGRIEVRATPAAAPRRERPSPGPKVMTLDDYVEQRSRGAR